MPPHQSLTGWPTRRRRRPIEVSSPPACEPWLRPSPRMVAARATWRMNSPLPCSSTTVTFGPTGTGAWRRTSSRRWLPSFPQLELASPMSLDSTPSLSLGKRLLFSLLLIGIALGTCELIAIWYLRAFNGYDGTHLYEYVFDPYKNVLPAPNYVDTRGIHHNRQGFRRTGEVMLAKPAGTYRIFLMGGSTAYGLGGLWPHIQRTFAVLKNSETIDAYLERILGDSVPGTHIEVINAAITSTWTHHELIYLNQTLLRYQPDMVLFLDGFNDFFFDNRDHDQFADYSYDLQSR